MSPLSADNRHSSFFKHTVHWLINELPTVFYQNNVAFSVLDDAKQAQDEHKDVEEVDDDWSPLEAHEVKDLPLHCSDLAEIAQQLIHSCSD